MLTIIEQGAHSHKVFAGVKEAWRIVAEGIGKTPTAFRGLGGEKKVKTVFSFLEVKGFFGGQVEVEPAHQRECRDGTDLLGTVVCPYVDPYIVSILEPLS